MEHAFGDAALLELREIESRTKMIAVADEHDGFDLLRRSAEPTFEQEYGLVVQRVALRRPGEMHDRDRVLQFHMDAGEIIRARGAHRAFPPRIRLIGEVSQRRDVVVMFHE